MVEEAKTISLGDRIYPVRKTEGKRLRQVDFEVEGTDYRGLEQNPNTKSRWAELARKGSQVMQFLQSGKYLAVIVDGKLTHFSSKKTS
ncbi:MAG: hypothetical protein WCE52_21185 [Candidatus Acidiferrum sp.]